MSNKINNIFNILPFHESIIDKIKYWNPYKDKIDKHFFENKKQYYILGPSIYDDMRYFWNFNVKFNNNTNELILGTTEQSLNLDQCISITINNNIGKINYLNNCKNYKGRDLVEWCIQIVENLGCNKCILIDNAEKKCTERNYNNYVPLSLIHKLWKNETYYEKFHFIPYDKNNNLYKNNKKDELNNYIQNLHKLLWSDFTILNEKWDLFMKKYKYFHNGPFEAFIHFEPDHCGIFYDILSLLNDPSQPCYETLQKVKNIISKSIWMKLL